MKKLIRISALLLVLVMMLGVFTACNKQPAANNSGTASGGTSSTGSNTGSTGSNTGSTGNTPSGGKTEDPYEVTFYFVWAFAEPSAEGTAQVEEALNKYLADKGYNFTVDICFMSMFEYAAQMDLLLAAGTKVDVAFCGFAAGGVAGMVSNGYLVNLDPYLDNVLADTVELEGRWLDCGRVNGSVYAIPCMKGYAMTWCYLYQTPYIEGINYDMSQLKSFYDEEEMFAKLHAAYPEMLLDRYGDYDDIMNTYSKTARIGSFGATVGENSTVVSYYESEAWKEAISWAWKYRQLGYLHPDGAQADTGMPNENVFIGYNCPNENDEETAAIQVSGFWNGAPAGAKAYAVQNMENTNLVWGVPYTSQNPQAAATLLNLMWTDDYVLNLVMWGIEDVSYVMVEETQGDRMGAFVYKDGMDRMTLPYCLYECYGIFGNEFRMLRWEGCSAATRDWMKKNLDEAWAPPLFGFTPDNSDVSVEVSSCSNVANQYENALLCGDLDPAQYNDVFVDAMKTAGLSVILEELNSQAQDWLTTK